MPSKRAACPRNRLQQAVEVGARIKRLSVYIESQERSLQRSRYRLAEMLFDLSELLGEARVGVGVDARAAHEQDCRTWMGDEA